MPDPLVCRTYRAPAEAAPLQCVFAQRDFTLIASYQWALKGKDQSILFGLPRSPG